MRKFYRFGVAISTLSLLANSFVGLAAAEVTGSSSNETTGWNSVNNAEINVEQNTFVEQQNSGTVENEIKLVANTGGNTASKNTGEGHVETGDIATGVGISNTLNKNVADLDSCGGCDMDITTSNEKTGAESDNNAQVDVTKNTTLQQENKADIKNSIFQDLNTGDNEANKNTGMGLISTGDIEAVSLVENLVNKNVANTGAGGGVAVLNASNETTGWDSDNNADISVELNNWMVQSNRAKVLNEAAIFANTGRNEASKNTGEGEIDTGDIDTGVGFTTEVNANFLSFDGCCDVELDVQNHKTGAESDNNAHANLTSNNTVFQSNCKKHDWWELTEDWRDGHGKGKCGVTNRVFGDLNTGENETKKNTADGVHSGDVEAAVEVSTDENLNVIGGPAWDLPDDVELGELPDGGWWMLWFAADASS